MWWPVTFLLGTLTKLSLLSAYLIDVVAKKDSK
jgi:hypothetical protein